jgi:predicted esterase YcpF (UPF0227 family)
MWSNVLRAGIILKGREKVTEIKVTEEQISTVKEYIRLTEKERGICYVILFSRGDIVLDSNLKAKVREGK